ncbi:oligosaccharide flippase family protein [Halorubrum salipaludis]|nr:oligosaccharide flippase family protein [Halorubrum salipaludis]
MKEQILRGIFSLAGSKVVTLILGIVTTPILVRILGPTQYGQYAFLMSVLGVIWIFVHMGISGGIQKYISEDREIENWSDQVFGFYFWLSMLLAIIATLVIFFMAHLGAVETLLGQEYTTYFYFISIILITGQSYYVLRYTLMGLQKEHISELLPVLHKVVFVVVGLPLAYIGYNVIGVLTGTIVAGILCAAVAFAMLRNYIETSAIYKPNFDKLPVKEFVTYNIWTIILVFLLNSLYHVDLLLLEPMTGSTEAGIYKTALVTAEFVWFIPLAIQRVFIHSTSDMWSQGDTKQITEVASQTTRFVLLLTLLLSLGIASLADPFINLYFGSDYSGAVVPLYLLLPGAVGFAVARPIIGIGQGKGNLRVLVYATGFAAVLNLFLNLVLIPIHGMHGAAVATTMGYGAMVFCSLITARYQGFDPLYDLRLPRIALTAVVTGTTIFVLSNITGQGILSLLVVPPVGFLIFGTLAIATRAIEVDEVQPILKRLPERLANYTNRFLRIIS